MPSLGDLFKRGSGHKKYSGIGPAVGACSICAREVYAVPGPVTIRLVTAGERDKIACSARWCPNCDTLYCLGDAIDQGEKCPKCHVTLVDHYHRRPKVERVVVGECEQCHRPLRVKTHGVKAEMRLTCKCGHVNTISSIPSA